jgi:DNA-binding MarR family transcriptional regulator
MALTPKQIRLASERAKALSDPTRFSVALVLLERFPEEASMTELIDEIGIDPSLISRHCTKLVDAGLAAKRPLYNFSLFKLTDEGAVLVRALVKTESGDGS